MKDDKSSIESILKTRAQYLQEDLKMLENKKQKLLDAEAAIIIKLIEQREQLISLQEQDE